MNKVTVGILSALLGGGAVYILVRRNIEERANKRADDEIASVIARFRQYASLETGPDATKEAKYVDKYDPSVIKHDIPKEKKYESKLEQYMAKGKPENDIPPRVIHPSEYGEQDEYEQLDFTYYADGTITDEREHPLDLMEIHDLFGDCLKQFGKYETDALHICNDRLHVYCEIIADTRTYSDVVKEKPHLKENKQLKK